MSNYSDRRRNVSIPAAILTHDVQAKHRALKFDPLRQTDAHVLTHINGNLSPARTRTLGALASKKTGRNQWVFPGKVSGRSPLGCETQAELHSPDRRPRSQYSWIG